MTQRVSAEFIESEGIPDNSVLVSDPTGDGFLVIDAVSINEDGTVVHSDATASNESATLGQLGAFGRSVNILDTDNFSSERGYEIASGTTSGTFDATADTNINDNATALILHCVCLGNGTDSSFVDIKPPSNTGYTRIVDQTDSSAEAENLFIMPLESGKFDYSLTDNNSANLYIQGEVV